MRKQDQNISRASLTWTPALGTEQGFVQRGPPEHMMLWQCPINSSPPHPPKILYETLQKELSQSVSCFQGVVKSIHLFRGSKRVHYPHSCLVDVQMSGTQNLLFIEVSSFNSVLIRGVSHNNNSLSSVVFDHFSSNI